MGNFSLQRSPWKFLKLQTGPSDSCLLLLPLSPSLSPLLCFCPAAHRRCSARAPPPATARAHASPEGLPTALAFPRCLLPRTPHCLPSVSDCQHHRPRRPPAHPPPGLSSRPCRCLTGCPPRDIPKVVSFG
jgi:hypothetical protein